MASKLPCWDAIMKSKACKKALNRALSTFNLGNNVMMHRWKRGGHDEADITIINYLLEAVKNAKKTNYE